MNETKKNDGGPAFPSIVGYRTPTDSYAAVESIEGLSVRDHVAVQILLGVVAHEGPAATERRFDKPMAGEHLTRDMRRAFDYADAFVAERDRRNGAQVAGNAELVTAVLGALDANGHLRGCEAGEGTDGDEDNCTPHCVAIRKALP